MIQSSLSAQPSRGPMGEPAPQHRSTAGPDRGAPSGGPEETTPELLEVGRLVAPQGLKGELRVLPLSDFPERFTRPGRRWLQARGAEARPVRLETGRQLPGKELFVVRFSGIADRSAAEAVVGHTLLVDASERPPLAPGEFHLLDLVGLEVRLLNRAGEPEGSSGAAIGRVTDLIHGGNDLLEIERVEPEGRRLLIPFVEAIVPEVHLREGWIGITPPPGLLDL
ncbi:MAG: ribosome maturation factor RimM [Cyanobacteriota bacterium]|nr:ribosome maturation factor RimM [Cyanobacteriota bacterium]